MLLLVALLLVRQMFAQAAVTDDQIEQQVLARLQLIDVERILNNNRIIYNYIRCMLRQGVCPPDARDFRKSLPRLVKHLCEKCTDKQRTSLKLIFSFVRNKFPEEWKQLIVIYAKSPEVEKRLNDFIDKP